MVQTHRSMKRRFGAVTGFVLASLFAISGVIPASASYPDCVYTPALDLSHKVTDKSLGKAVKAMAWQWQPGSDASNASLYSQGTKVSVVTGNLRQITFGVLHQGISQTQDLRVLTDTNPNTIAALNGDYFDDNGPWSAMVQDGQVLYAPPVNSGVVGLIRHKVKSSTGYMSTGILKINGKKYNVTGVNQLKPGPSSLVVYKSDFVRPTTPKGQLTVVIKSGKVLKIYPKGSAVSTKAGTVIQVNGNLVPFLAKLKTKTFAKLYLPPVPQYESRLAAESVSAVGSVSSKSNTVNFDSVNFANLSNSVATLFDENYVDSTRTGRTTIRIGPDGLGNLVVRNVYKYGASREVDPGGYVLQATGTAAAAAAAKFKVGEIVTVSRAHRSTNKQQFVAAAGRGPRILQGGKFVWVCANHNKDLRPRSAIGWNQDGQIWLMSSSLGYESFDFGFRQGGSTSSQMGEWLLALGATDAVLLDGGGSTTMQINDPGQGWKRFDLPDSAWFRELANAFSIESKN